MFRENYHNEIHKPPQDISRGHLSRGYKKGVTVQWETRRAEDQEAESKYLVRHNNCDNPSHG